MRSGETERTQMGGCRRSSWWIVSGWSYTLSLLYVPGEVGKKEYTSPFQWEAWSKNILCLIIPTKSLLKVGGQGGAWQRFSSAVVQREMTSYFELPICPERGPFLRHHTFPRVFLYYLLLYCRGNFCLYMPIQAAVHTTQPNISHWGGLRYLHVLVATTVRGTLGYLNESSSSHTC